MSFARNFHMVQNDSLLVGKLRSLARICLVLYVPERSLPLVSCCFVPCGISQCKMQTADQVLNADCRLQTRCKMQTKEK